MNRSVVLLGSGAVTAAVIVGGIVGSGARAADDRVAIVATSGSQAGDGTATSRISLLQKHLELTPRDDRSWATLGLAYVDQARVVAEPSYYPKAAGAIAKSLALAPTDNDAGWAAQATLNAARHEFGAALVSANKALTVNGYNQQALAIRTDALIELGRYREADAAAQLADDRSPGFATLTRLSYLSELRGDLARASLLMRQALDDASEPTQESFALLHLGELARIQGDLEKTTALVARALALEPANSEARATQARVELARGHTSKGLALYAALVEVAPLPQYLTDYGDALAANGRDAKAQGQYDVVRAVRRLAQANGVRIERESAVFLADQGDKRDALTAARAAWRAGHSVYAADAMAWALHAVGQDRAAWNYALKATSLGTQDARLLYHRGVIAHALGSQSEAHRDLSRALNLDPVFSMTDAAKARALLATIGNAR